MPVASGAGSGVGAAASRRLLNQVVAVRARSLPASGVTAHVPVPVADAYCTDQPERFTGDVPRLNSSMKSFVSVAPLLPPPP